MTPPDDVSEREPVTMADRDQRRINLAKGWIRWWKYKRGEPPFDVAVVDARPVQPHGAGRGTSPLGMTEGLLEVLDRRPADLDEAHAHAADEAAKTVTPKCRRSGSERYGTPSTTPSTRASRRCGMTDVSERLSEIRERTEAVTEGPWEDHDRGGTVCKPTGEQTCRILAEMGGQINYREDARFIAEARSDVPYLLSLVERYQKALLDWDQDVCWCGHPRIDHAAHDASPRCFIDGCDCEGYAALRDAAQEGAE